MDSVGEEAKESTDPEQHREATKQLLAELDPLGRLPRRRERIRSIALEHLLGLRRGQAGLGARLQAGEQFGERDLVLVHRHLLLEVLEIISVLLRLFVSLFGIDRSQRKVRLVNKFQAQR